MKTRKVLLGTETYRAGDIVADEEINLARFDVKSRTRAYQHHRLMQHVLNDFQEVLFMDTKRETLHRGIDSFPPKYVEMRLTLDVVGVVKELD